MRAKLCSPYVCEITQRKWWMQKQPDLILSVLCLSVFQNRTNRGVKICSEKKGFKRSKQIPSQLIGHLSFNFYLRTFMGHKGSFFNIYQAYFCKTYFLCSVYLPKISGLIFTNNITNFTVKITSKKNKKDIFVMHFKFQQLTRPSNIAKLRIKESIWRQNKDQVGGATC